MEKKALRKKQGTQGTQEPSSPRSLKVQSYVDPTLAYQHVQHGPGISSPTDVLSLQKTVGNQAIQRKLARTMDHGARSLLRAASRLEFDRLLPPQTPAAEPIQRVAETAAPRKNATGLPDRLKAGVERLSGLSLDDVQVHFSYDASGAVCR